jgi:hypothetical protein
MKRTRAFFDRTYSRPRRIKRFNPENSDGCTWVPDFNIKDCCVKHDKAYYYGGSAGQRKFADIRFRNCILRKGCPFLAWVYYFGVRIFGGPLFPTRFRWGKGFKYNESNFYSNQSTEPASRGKIKTNKGT